MHRKTARPAPCQSALGGCPWPEPNNANNNNSFALFELFLHYFCILCLPSLCFVANLTVPLHLLICSVRWVYCLLSLLFTSLHVSPLYLLVVLRSSRPASQCTLGRPTVPQLDLSKFEGNNAHWTLWTLSWYFTKFHLQFQDVWGWLKHMIFNWTITLDTSWPSKHVSHRFTSRISWHLFNFVFLSHLCLSSANCKQTQQIFQNCPSRVRCIIGEPALHLHYKHRPGGRTQKHIYKLKLLMQVWQVDKSNQVHKHPQKTLKLLRCVKCKPPDWSCQRLALPSVQLSAQTPYGWNVIRMWSEKDLDFVNSVPINSSHQFYERNHSKQQRIHTNPTTLQPRVTRNAG